MNTCSKPGCSQTAVAILSYDYSSRLAFLDDPPPGLPSPHVYTLCMTCSDKLAPPRGWLLDDRRSEPPLFAPARQQVSPFADVVDEPPDDDPPPDKRQLFFGYSG